MAVGLFALAFAFAGARPAVAADGAEPHIIAVSAASSYSLGLDASGGVWAWGNNFLGQLCDGTTVNRLTPVRVRNPSDPTGQLAGVAAVSAQVQSLFLMQDGTVRACGDNAQGQLGDGTQDRRTTPVQVKDPGDATGFLTGVTAIVAGNGFSLALKEDGTARGWGINDFGQLGDGTTTGPRLLPVQVVDPTDPSGFLSGVRALSAGVSHSIALKIDGTVRAWGRGPFGQLGDGTTSIAGKPIPVRVKDLADPTGFLTGVIAIDASQASHNLALKADGSARSWGQNESGQLGDGTTVGRASAVAVAEVPHRSRFTSVETGQSYRSPAAPTAPPGAGATTPEASSATARWRHAGRRCRCAIPVMGGAS